MHRGRFAAETGAPVVELDEALERADVVAICSPSERHAAQVRQALDAGCHVVVDFPVALSTDEAVACFDLARANSKIVHVGHIELLTATSQTLCAMIRPFALQSAIVRFSGPSASQVPGQELAFRNVARLHRIVAIGGPVTHIDEVAIRRGELRAKVRLEGGATVKLEFRASPGLKRSTTMELHEVHGDWGMRDGLLLRKGQPQTLLHGERLFAQDHAWAVRRIIDGVEPYLSDRRVLHVLQLAERLRDAELGEMPPDKSDDNL